MKQREKEKVKGQEVEEKAETNSENVKEGKHINSVMRRLTTGIRSKKCFVRRFLPCAKVIECTYTNLDSTL